jgi:predicted nucleic acid-binding protein
VKDAWRGREFLRISDAFYAACAQHLEAGLLTTDHRMARALDGRISLVPFD